MIRAPCGLPPEVFVAELGVVRRITTPFMAGKFLKRDAIIDTVVSEQRMNARRKRVGLKNIRFGLLPVGVLIPIAVPFT